VIHGWDFSAFLQEQRQGDKIEPGTATILHSVGWEDGADRTLDGSMCLLLDAMQVFPRVLYARELAHTVC
jgi:hypothetical protein